MSLDQINELINRGGAAFALFLVAAILLFHVFKKDIEKVSGK